MIKNHNRKTGKGFLSFDIIITIKDITLCILFLIEIAVLSSDSLPVWKKIINLRTIECGLVLTKLKTRQITNTTILRRFGKEVF